LTAGALAAMVKIGRANIPGAVHMVRTRRLSMGPRARFACVVLFGFSCLAGGAQAQDSPAASAADWPLERVTLTDGKQYQGLVKSASDTVVEFVEVHRPRGKPMFLLVRSIDRKLVDRIERLGPAERETLRNRLERHRQRTLIEASRMEDLKLTSTRREGQLVWNYQGAWFALASTADESMTRRAIVRLEQMFTAYRQVLPPRRASAARLEIRIFGASDQYQKALAAEGLAIKNPAVYLQDRKLILAGSNMNQFEAALAEVTREHRRIREAFDTLVDEAPSRINQLQETLKKHQIPAAERQKIVAAEGKKWEEQRRAVRRKIAALERGNAAKFEQVAGQMFRRLAHEAFHAYLETFVYPRGEYDVPRWLNEGLAQTFEAGLLEADTLRVDTPNLVALERLKSDLAGGSPLPVAELLEAGGETFLAGHADDGQMVSRAYYYSWGLAYYLAFEHGVLGSDQFEAYLKGAASDMSPVARFETLVGMPLGQFEREWRGAMLALKSTP
jgi:hypothetical protein